MTLAPPIPKLIPIPRGHAINRLALTAIALHALAILVALALVAASDTGYAGVTTLTVNSTAWDDDGSCDALPAGDCNFREAVLLLTNNSRIEFDIPSTSDPNCNVGTGVCTIAPTSGIGSISESNVAIDGYTQLGAQPNTMSTGNDADLKVQFDIANYGGLSSFLDVTGAGFELTGIAVDGVVNTSILALETGADNSWVHANFLGMDVSGSATTSSGGIPGVYVIGANDVTIGGPNVADRNVIAGNQEEISLLQGDATVIQNNYIGTNAAGAAALAADSSAGIAVSPGVTNAVIGGNSASARNVISGNRIGINSQADAVRIQGNYIGTNAAGTAAVPNEVDGISVSGDSTLVGGTGAGERNVISGNAGAGVNISNGSGHQVSGNYIGTNAAGTAAIPNDVGVADNGAGTIIGGGQSAARNVISGNSASGVELYSQSVTTALTRNYIGTNAGGTGAIPNETGVRTQSTGADIFLNLISGNTGAGVAVAAEGDGTTIRANRIGTNAAGTGDLGNAVAGVFVHAGAEEVRIGGTIGADANLIANNGTGVVVGPAEADGGPFRVGPAGGPPPGPASAAVLRNAIAANDSLGIDIIPILGHNSTDPGDGDSGPNSLQNAPALDSAVAGSTLVNGSLDSTPNRDFRLELFASVNCDPSGFGEGLVFFGSATLHTDADGAIGFAVLSGLTAQVGSVLTATVTDLTTNETSEFSNCVDIVAGPTPTPFGQTPSPSPTGPVPTPTPTPIPVVTPEPSTEVTDEPTPVATPTPTASPIPTAGPSGTPGPTGSGSPTVTATPFGTPTPVATCDPLATCTPPPTPAPTPAGQQRTWGDDNCSGDADPIDSLLTLRHDAGLTVNTGDCPGMGEVVEVANASPHPWGDIDCSGEVNPVDSLKLLRFDAGLDVSQPANCPEIGDPVLVS